MGRYVFRLPDVGEGVAEAEIVAWYVKPGDTVQEDQTLVDVMTDKATVDIASPVSGTVVSIQGAVGEVAAVGSVLVELEIEGAGNTPDAPAPAKTTKPQQAPAKKLKAGSTTTPTPAVVQTVPLAAPATRKQAKERGIALESVQGSGPGGRITLADLDAYAASSSGQLSVLRGVRRMAVHEQKIVGLRRKIAERMQDSKRRIPHFGYVEEFDLTELEALRKTLNDERASNQPKLTLLPFFIRALVLLQPDFPHINARYDDEAEILTIHDAVHVGIATQTENGLMVPVVRHAESLDIWDAARELARVTAGARDGSATRDELSGSTITLTSLGVLGGVSAMPIINAPEVGIIGPNKLEERPVVRQGQIVIRTMMNVSTAFDHRIVDGHVAASFVQRMKRLIETPALLFLERSSA